MQTFLHSLYTPENGESTILIMLYLKRFWCNPITLFQRIDLDTGTYIIIAPGDSVVRLKLLALQ